MDGLSYTTIIELAEPVGVVQLWHVRHYAAFAILNSTQWNTGKPNAGRFDPQHGDRAFLSPSPKLGYIRDEACEALC